jgi:hypothetical protein
MSNYNSIDGAQRKILRATVRSIFTTPDRIDSFLQDNNLGSLQDYAAGDALYDDQLRDLIQELRARGRLDHFVGLLRSSDYRANVDLLALNDRLGLVADAASEEKRPRVLDVNLESAVRGTGFADLYAWTTNLVQLGRAICQIRYPVLQGILTGTGFLISSNVVLTNHHVVSALLDGDADPENVEIAFEDPTPDGGSVLATCRLAKNDWHVYSSSGDLDFAAIRLADNPADQRTGTKSRQWVDSSTATTVGTPGSIVFVLQHPRGEPLKQSVGLLQQAPLPQQVCYDADTDEGSSGSLVVNDRLQPIALHRAGGRGKNYGVPLNLIHRLMPPLSVPNTNEESDVEPTTSGATFTIEIGDLAATGRDLLDLLLKDRSLSSWSEQERAEAALFLHGRDTPLTLDRSLAEQLGPGAEGGIDIIVRRMDG